MARHAFVSLSRAVSLVAFISAGSIGAAVAQGQAPAPTPATPADIETSPYSFVGEVNTDGVVLRSGANESDYGVMKLAKGTRLTVVGLRFDWLKVEPPEGAFCVVSQAFVNRQGDGRVGRINAKGAVVRIGSVLSGQKHRAPMQLDVDDTVQILAEEQEYYRITPPKGVYMYVDKRFVDPVRRADAAGVSSPGTTTPDAPATATETITSFDDVATAEGAPTGPVTPPVLTEQPLPDTTGTEGDRFVVKSDVPAGATQTVEEAAKQAETVRVLQEKLSKLEDRYAAAGQQELSEQPLDTLLADYNKLLADTNLPPNARKVAEFRAQQLQLRKDALAQFIEARKIQEEAAAKQKDLKAEEEELQQRLAAVAVKRYTAIGKLMQSSLQVGNQTLYRLVDPSTGRLVMYVRVAKAPVGTALDKFIGVSGQVVNDESMRLTYVSPESFDIVDPTQVNSKVFADYTPPSLAGTNVAGESPNQ
jgi:hypothetical protein